MKKFLISLLALASTISPSPAKAGTYSTQINGSHLTYTISATYIGQVGASEHIVKDYSELRDMSGLPSHYLWGVRCDDGGYWKWLGDENTEGWKKWRPINHSDKTETLFYNTSCRWQ